MGTGATGREPRRAAIARLAALTAATALLLAGATGGVAVADDAGGHTPSAEDRYSLANGCFALRSQQNGNYVAKAAGAYLATAGSAGAAERFRMQPTDLGRYLLYDSGRAFMARGLLLNNVRAANSPSDNSDWAVEEDGGAFRLKVAGRGLAVGAGGALTTVPGGGGAAGLFGFEPADGCPAYPEIEVNVDGPLPPSGSPSAPVRGFVETHMHQMAFEFLGTKAHCGRPWHRFGAPFALVDCPDHAVAAGCLAVLETALTGTSCHGAGGWPDFGGWPEHSHFTHEQSYYKWLERNWRGGLRIFVNLLVENRILCELYPIKPLGHSCDEMVTVRREAQRMRELERYIDAQNGGPGKGWYRIVESPAEARRAIADGKLAVVMGMEVSEPFGCILNALTNTSQCTEQELDAGIDEVYDLGVRQLEIINKFDNGLSGVAGDSGTVGTITNTGNFLSTLSFWQYEHCDEPVNHDRSPTGLEHNDDVLIANGLAVFADLSGVTLPVYGPPPHCNQRGLSQLGERAIRRMMSKGMMFDPDHMSVIGRNQALDLLESEGYPGVMTSHSWSTDDALPRISALGGLIGPKTGSSRSYVEQWAHIKQHGYDQENPHLFGFGYGADMNGFASQGGPRAPDAANPPVSYPFPSPIFPGVTVDRQVSGQRTYDINSDGVAHYGLYPDWAEDVRILGGPGIAEDMANGAEAYLQMWERTVGSPGPGGPGGGPGGGAGDQNVGPGSRATASGCAKWPRRLSRRGLGKRLRLGDDRETVLRKAGPPRSRGRAWVWCAKGGPRPKQERVAAVFDKRGRVALILTTAGKARAGKIRRGAKLAALRKRARPIGGKLWRAVKAPKGGRYVYKVRKGRVAFSGVATKSLAKNKRALRKRIALAGLR